MPIGVRGQHLVDAADDGDLLHKGIHLLVARQGSTRPRVWQTASCS